MVRRLPCGWVPDCKSKHSTMRFTRPNFTFSKVQLPFIYEVPWSNSRIILLGEVYDGCAYFSNWKLQRVLTLGLDSWVGWFSKKSTHSLFLIMRCEYFRNFLTPRFFAASWYTWGVVQDLVEKIDLVFSYEPIEYLLTSDQFTTSTLEICIWQCTSLYYWLTLQRSWNCWLRTPFYEAETNLVVEDKRMGETLAQLGKRGSFHDQMLKQWSNRMLRMNEKSSQKRNAGVCNVHIVFRHPHMDIMGVTDISYELFRFRPIENLTLNIEHIENIQKKCWHMRWLILKYLVPISEIWKVNGTALCVGYRY